MIFDQRDHALVIRAIGVVEVGLVHQNHCLTRNFRDNLAHFILRRDAGGGIVGVANVDKTFFRRGRHFVEVMAKA